MGMLFPDIGDVNPAGARWLDRMEQAAGKVNTGNKNPVIIQQQMPRPAPAWNMGIAGPNMVNAATYDLGKAISGAYNRVMPIQAGNQRAAIANKAIMAPLLDTYIRTSTLANLIGGRHQSSNELQNLIQNIG